jgi:hypothetical protein
MLSAWTNLLTKEQADASNAAFEKNRSLERAAIDAKFEGRTKKRRSTRGRAVNVRSTSHPVQARSARVISPELQERINFLVDSRDLNLYPLSGYEKLCSARDARRRRMMADVLEQI